MEQLYRTGEESASVRGHRTIPRQIMFLVSAVMVNKPTSYDASLETFSQPLLRLLDYELN